MDASNNIIFKEKQIEINNSMLLFLGTQIFENTEYALWSIVLFRGERINDSESSEVYVDLEFMTPVVYNEKGNIKLISPESELIFSKIHHIRLGSENIRTERQEKGIIKLENLSSKADNISFKVAIILDGSPLEISYRGIAKLVVMQ